MVRVEHAETPCVFGRTLHAKMAPAMLGDYLSAVYSQNVVQLTIGQAVYDRREEDTEVSRSGVGWLSCDVF